jgi:hypothetical protein
MSQDRPASRDGSTKIINMNHVLTHPTTTQMQYSSSNNNNNNLIINKNNLLAIETAAAAAANSSANSHLLVHKNLSAMPSISTSPPSMSYISEYRATSLTRNNASNTDIDLKLQQQYQQTETIKM